MNTIFMNSKNSLTSDPRRLLLSLTNKLNLERSAKHVALSNLSIYYTWKNVKMSYKNDKFEISAPTLIEEFELLDGSLYLSDIQEYYKYIATKTWRKE